MPRPDAVKFPESAVPADDVAPLHERVVLLAEELLGVDLGGDEFARCADQEGWYFCTRSSLDGLRRPGPLILNPATAPARPGLPRYRWEPGPGGVEFGTLIDDD